MQIVLDLLPKLLSLCTSTTIIIDSDIEGGGVCMNEFRVLCDILFFNRIMQFNELLIVIGMIQLFVLYFHVYVYDHFFLSYSRNVH